MHLTVIIIVSLILITFLSGLETAFSTSDKLRLELGSKENPLFSWLVLKISGKNSLFFTTIAVGFTLSSVVFSVFAIIFVETHILNTLDIFFLKIFIEIFIITLCVLLFGLFIPKIFFRFAPGKTLLIFSLPLALVYFMLFPVVKFLNMAFLILFSKSIPSAENPKDQLFSHSDFLQLENEEKVSRLNIEHNIEKEVMLLRNALDFSKVKLREILVPRNEIALLDINSDIETLKKRFIETGFSRILFFEDNKDNIVGYVHSSAIFQNAKQIKPFLKNVLIVPETMAANRLLSRFIREHRSIALVVDEFGGTAGLVTSEDILEEIFGEIEDEHDTRAIFEKRINERQFIFSGRYEIDALNEKYHWDIPDSDQYETLAGFILYHYESIPRVNTVIRIGKWSIRILKATTTKIELVQFSLPEEN